MSQRSLKEFFADNRRAAVAFSGGVDSSYLLYAASKYADSVKAFYVKSQFQPQFELEDAGRVADFCGAELKVITVDILACEEVAANPADRCYHCKRRIMRAVKEAASADGYELIIDGSNASDDEDDRPGHRALAELGIRSPLRECGIGKEQVRQLAREAGLHVWDKPAYACLATRIPAGEHISASKLETTERAEEILHGMGFRGFRVRLRDGAALVQVNENQYAKALEAEKEIASALEGMYTGIMIDTEMRKGI